MRAPHTEHLIVTLHDGMYRCPLDNSLEVERLIHRPQTLRTATPYNTEGNTRARAGQWTAEVEIWSIERESSGGMGIRIAEGGVCVSKTRLREDKALIYFILSLTPNQDGTNAHSQILCPLF